MNFRYALMLCGASVGLIMMFVGTALGIGVSQRQPSTVTITSHACQLLPANLAFTRVGSFCHVDVDDFKHDGQLVRLWLASDAGKIFKGETITLPVDAIKVAVELPKRQTPLWIIMIPGVGVLLLLSAIAAFGLEVRKMSASRSISD